MPRKNLEQFYIQNKKWAWNETENYLNKHLDSNGNVTLKHLFENHKWYYHLNKMIILFYW